VSARHENLVVVGEAADGLEAVRLARVTTRPGALDINLPK